MCQILATGLSWKELWEGIKANQYPELHASLGALLTTQASLAPQGGEKIIAQDLLQHYMLCFSDAMAGLPASTNEEIPKELRSREDLEKAQAEELPQILKDLRILILIGKKLVKRDQTINGQCLS